MSTPLTDRINALTAYSNQKTGASDTTLSDAVTRLVAGYGGGSAEIEEGTYTPTEDEAPNISFSNSHTRTPDVVMFGDVSENFPSTGVNTILAYFYYDIENILGNSAFRDSTTKWSKFYVYMRLASGGGTGASLSKYSARSDVTQSGFIPYMGTSGYMLRAGQTYSWKAIWL